MPTPNSSPPTRPDSHSQRGPAYTVSAGCTQPPAASTPKPSVATPAASAHWRSRVVSPMFTTSLMAPMVQKPVRCMMAPNTADSAKVPSSTARSSRSRSGGCGMGRDSIEPRSGSWTRPPVP